MSVPPYQPQMDEQPPPSYSASVATDPVKKQQLVQPQAPSIATGAGFSQPAPTLQYYPQPAVVSQTAGGTQIVAPANSVGEFYCLAAICF